MTPVSVTAMARSVSALLARSLATACALAAGALLLLGVGAPAELGAQVRPDSVRRDTTVRDTVVRDTVVRDTIVRDTIVRDTVVRDTIVRDTVPRDSAARAPALPDTLSADSLAALALAEATRDTLQAALARWPVPDAPEPVAPLVWDRRALLATGAVHLNDLLDLVPGVTSFRTSWLAGVHTASYLGDFRRLRIFLDGVELDSPDPRTDGLLDHVDIPILSIDEVRIERAAGELRVWLRSFATTSTTAISRTDVITGDLNTNGFRGLLGRRWRNGVALAVTAQQVESQRQRGGGIFAAPGAAGSVGDGDYTQYTVRGGWARGRLAADVLFVNTTRGRDPTEAREEEWALPAYAGTRRETITRLGWRADSTRGLWAQAYSASLSTRADAPEEAGAAAGGGSAPTTGIDSTALARADSGRARAQRAVAVGWRGARSSATLTSRWRDAGNGAEFAPVLQAAHDRGWAVVALHAERLGLDSARRLDLTGTWRLRPWLRLGVAHSLWRPDARPTISIPADTAGGGDGNGSGDGGDDGGDDGTGDGAGDGAADDPPVTVEIPIGPRRSGVNVSRAELAVGWKDRWLTAGLVSERANGDVRDVNAPRLLTPYDSALGTPRFPESPLSGVTAAFQGRLFKDVRLNVRALRWSEAREWRPLTQVNTQLILSSRWLSRFPKGHFGINLRLLHEYRSAITAFVPTPDGSFEPRQSEPQNLGHVLLEIRILSAIVSYQYRNVFGAAYEQVPGVTMPPPHQFYGVRWEWTG